MNQKIDFSSFPDSSMEQWKKLVQKELGEKPFESLLWQDENGLHLQPYFTREGAAVVAKEPAIEPKFWDVYQAVSGENAQEVNALILQSLMGGANAIGIRFDISSKAEMMEVLKDVILQYIAIHFEQQSQPEEVANWLLEILAEQGQSSKSIKGSVSSTTAAIHFSDRQIKALADLSVAHFSLFKSFEIDAYRVHENGGAVVQELSYALAAGNEMLQRLTELGYSIDDASAMLQFHFSAGNSYFIEIAKLRVFRKLWALIIDQYKPQHTCTQNAFVHVTTSRILQTEQDPYNNLLRATTQAMSAIVGGANSVHVSPYNERFEGVSENSLRWSRNIQHLLIEESYLAEASQAAEGAYYIEEIETQLSEKAWSSFQTIEALGGITNYTDQLEEQIEQSKLTREQAVAEGTRVIVGVNKYKASK